MSTKQTKPAELPPGIPVTSQVTIVARLIVGLREQIFQIELVQEANAHSPEDMYADRGVSYEAAIGELRAAEKRVASKHKQLMPQVEDALGNGDPK